MLGEVRFTGGTGAATSATFEVVAKADVHFGEADETVTLGVSRVAEQGISGGGKVSFPIVNGFDIEVSTRAEFSLGAERLGEAAGARVAELKVVLSEPAPRDLSIRYAAGAASTASASDFAALAGEVVVKKGGTEAPLGFRVADDALDEAPEILALILEEGTGYRPGARTEYVATVVDDDATPVGLRFEDAEGRPATALSESEVSRFLTIDHGRVLVPGEVLSYRIGLAGTATLGEDYRMTAPPSPGIRVAGLGTGTVTVTVIGVEGGTARAAKLELIGLADDDADEGTETIEATLGAPSGAQPRRRRCHRRGVDRAAGA